MINFLPPPWRKLGLIALCLLLPLSCPAAQDRYFQTSDGLTLHYLEAGSGEDTIVFIPGWLMPAAIFEAQLEGLSRHYRVLAFDPRSQGASDLFAGSHAPDIRLRDMGEFLAAAGVTRFVLAGWSLGVLESLDYVEQRRPAGLRGMVLIDNSIGEGEAPPPRKSQFFEDLANPQRRPKLLEGFCRSMFKREPPAAISRAVLASTLRASPAAARQLLGQPYARTYWRDIVGGLEVPVLYAITPRLHQQGAILARKKPDQATVLEFDGAGHALFVDQAERFNAAVLALAGRAFGREASVPGQ